MTSRLEPGKTEDGEGQIDSGAGCLRLAGVRVKRQTLALAILLVVAVVAPFVLSSFHTFQLTIALAFILCLAGLDVTLGYGGIINVATAAFFGIGAYTTLIGVRLTETTDFVYLAIPLAAILGIVGGLVCAAPVTRLRGWNVALFTLGITVAFPPILNRYSNFTGGSAGIAMERVKAPAWAPLANDEWVYLVALVVVVLLYIAYRQLVDGMPGRLLLATQTNELAARALGVNTRRYKRTAFVVGSTFAAVGGALHGMVSGFVQPQTFAPLLAISFLVGIIVGGRTWVLGPIAGGLFLQYARLFAEDVFQEGLNLVYGVILILVLYLAPRGLRDVPARLAQLGTVITAPFREQGRAARATRTGKVSELTEAPPVPYGQPEEDVKSPSSSTWQADGRRGERSKP